MKSKLVELIQLFIILSSVICKPGDMIINGSVISSKQFQAQKLVSNSLVVQQMIQESHSCSAQNVFSEQIVANQITLKRILVTNQEGVLELNGDVIIEQLEVEENAELSSFLQTNQWQLAYHDHFEDKVFLNTKFSFELIFSSLKQNINNKSLVGWNISQVQLCQDSEKDNNQKLQNNDESDKDYFLGGHCVGPSDLKLTKQYKELPKHKNIRIQARVHFFDKWEGETLTLFVDDKIAWTKTVEAKDSNTNICGGKSNDPHFGLPVEVNIPHKENFVSLKFESNLSKDRCVASFAIDDVEIFVR